MPGGAFLQEVTVTPLAVNLESEGLRARVISSLEIAHMCFDHVGEETVVCALGFEVDGVVESLAHDISGVLGNSTHRGEFVGSALDVSPRVCRQVFRCVSVIPLYIVHLSLLCLLLGMGFANHAVVEFEVADLASESQDVALVLRQVVRNLDGASEPLAGAPFRKWSELFGDFDEDHCDAHFEASDRDGNGLISFGELKRAVKRLPMSLVGAEIKFRKADVDGDGSLEWVEHFTALSDW